MKLVSTRDFSASATLSDALLSPSAAFGGLYTPRELPKFAPEFWSECKELSYKQIALKLIKALDFDISPEVFKTALARYDSFENPALPLEISKFNDNTYILELYHGPTLAFKDMALQPFGALLGELAAQRNEKYLIICATSGDTGPATLETFANDPNIKVVCLYPAGGTSEIQRQQMVKQSAKNLKILGIKGNFDDAQRALKSLLSDDDFKNELKANNLCLSAANSVNFGRILFQIIYYIYASVQFSKNPKFSAHDKFDVIVPSGNFGNALGAYFAKKMGANIGKIKIASNANNILTDLIKTGIYDLRGRELISTISPAMDILISSNVERVLADLFGDVRTKELMASLAQDKFYALSKDELAKLQSEFEADFTSDDECSKFIKEASSSGRLIDPHTANCFKLLGGDTPTLIVSTAKWIKFTPSMIKAIKSRPCEDEKADMIALSKEFKSDIPAQISRLFASPEIHTSIIEQNEIKNTIIDWIKL
ncbi:threonine synthase [Campylobacter sp. JMF_02 ED1]|uniref:threonine synthase n=1 Tax=unclassified Campylobacter TaxID=2593542 RepID=UPI0022E99D44|nr:MULTISPECIES: threonine synthase [unclassified Campylobacter]MDA3049180.1 threonine synthase [Campylobacter sp. JMF_15 NE4]MDA3051395.1 threonine synthase [Campylobacter sp. JMF_02 ED1]